MAWPIVILASAGLVLLFTAFDIQFFVRPAVVIWFMTVCPGMAWVQAFHVERADLRWTLAISATLSVDLLLAMGMLYLGRWSPTSAMVILVVIAGAGVLLDRMMPRLGNDSEKSIQR